MIIYKANGEAYAPTTETPANWNLYYPTVSNAGNGAQNAGSNATISTSGLTAFTLSGATFTSGLIYYHPIVFAKTMVLSKLGLILTTSNVLASGVIGVYASQPRSSGYTINTAPLPGNLLSASAGAALSPSGPWLQSLSTPVTLSANTVYWLAFNHNSSSIQFAYQGAARSIGASGPTVVAAHWRQTFSYTGTLPATASGVIPSSAIVPIHLLGWQ